MITTDAGGTLVTGGHIQVVRWVSIKGAMKLESLGLKSRFGPLRPKFASELGLKPRDSYEKFIEIIEAKIESLRVVADAQDATK